MKNKKYIIIPPFIFLGVIIFFNLSQNNTTQNNNQIEIINKENNTTSFRSLNIKTPNKNFNHNKNKTNENYLLSDKSQKELMKCLKNDYKLETIDSVLNFFNKKYHIKEYELHYKNYHIKLENYEERRIHITKETSENNKSSINIKIFKLDFEGYPEEIIIDKKTTLDEKLHYLTRNGDIFYTESFYGAKVTDAYLDLEFKNDTLTKLHIIGKNISLGCNNNDTDKITECVCIRKFER